MLKRHTFHFDEDDIRALAKIAREESNYTGMSVTVAGTLRRLVKDFLRSTPGYQMKPKRKKKK